MVKINDKRHGKDAVVFVVQRVVVLAVAKRASAVVLSVVVVLADAIVVAAHAEADDVAMVVVWNRCVHERQHEGKRHEEPGKSS